MNEKERMTYLLNECRKNLANAIAEEKQGIEESKNQIKRMRSEIAQIEATMVLVNMMSVDEANTASKIIDIIG